jgi:predicted dehydrogenase
MTLKIAIVGTGSVARQNYLPYLSARKDISLTYFSRTRSKAEACAREFGGQVFGSLQTLIGEDPDAVLVLTGERERYAATLPILECKPRRIFFEKPLVAEAGQANVAETDFFMARELLERAEAAGTQTAMVFNYRFFDQAVRAQRILEERSFGKLTQAVFFVNYACWSHCIDLLHLFGGRAAWISALAGGTAYQGAVDVSAAFRLENGACGTILGTSGGKFDYSLYELELHFEHGNLHFKDLDGALEVNDHTQRYRETHGLIDNYSRWNQYAASFEKSLAAYLDTVAAGSPPPIPGRAGLEELQFEAALRRSIAEHRPVEVQNEFSLHSI